MIDPNITHSLVVLMVVLTLFVSTCLMINNLINQVNKLNAQVRKITKTLETRVESEEHKIEEGEEWKYK
jgi:cell division protein FtsB